MNFKRTMIIVGSSLLAFGGMFLAVRSCNAAPEQAEKTEAEVKADLLDKVQRERMGLEDQMAKMETLTAKTKMSEKIARLHVVETMLKEEQQEESAEIKETRRSYVRHAADEFQSLVPVYSGNETEHPSGFGKTYSQALFAASNEHREVRTVKEAVLNRLQEAHTRAVLDQDVLHVPEYSALIYKATQEATNKDGIDTAAALAETLQQERLADEQAIEELANPSFWQTVKWWWNS